MRYVLLLHGDPDGLAALARDEQQAVLARSVELDAALRDAGKTVDGAELQPAPADPRRATGGASACRRTTLTRCGT